MTHNLISSSERHRHFSTMRPTIALFAAFTNPSSLRSNAARSLTSLTMASSGDKQLVVDPFCFRQFAEHEASKEYKGTVFNMSVEEFEAIVNSRYDEANLKDGYAPFCKHIFLKNDIAPDAKSNILPITKENEHLLRSKYEARNDKELPVLTRWFPSELVGDNMLPTAEYLDLILYSREQINKENESMGSKPGREGEAAPWGIVSIKAQGVDYELPMTPITAMRNALGKEHGGSGVEIDRDAYMEAYNFWKDHATVS